MSLFTQVLDTSPRIFGLRVADHDNDQVISNLQRIAKQKADLMGLNTVSRAIAAQISQCNEATKLLTAHLDRNTPAATTAE